MREHEREKNIRGLVKGNFYHILNRGVDKRNIFLDNKDYFRFIRDLFEFNDTASPPNINYFFHKYSDIVHKYSDIASPNIPSPNIISKTRKRKLLVEILVFSLMPNHYHLLLRQKVKNGISRFMKKLNMGYAKYFNEKNRRSGALFEGRYKSIDVTNEMHFLWLPYYIHCNPLDLKFPRWRGGNIEDYKEAVKFLESYRWSSHLDYLGKKNFPSVTQREFLMEIFGTAENYRKGFRRWLKDMELETKKNLLLE